LYESSKVASEILLYLSKELDYFCTATLTCAGRGRGLLHKKGEKFKESGKAHVVHLLAPLSLILKLAWCYTDKSRRE